DVGFGFAEPEKIAKAFGLADLPDEKGWIVIWTTTPWTIPGNQALNAHPQHVYNLVATERGLLILAADLQDACLARYRLSGETLASCKGKALELIGFRHPFFERLAPVYLGEYVVLDTGTGIVHSAPAYGVEDFDSCRHYGMKDEQILTPVTGSGKFVASLPFLWILPLSLYLATFIFCFDHPRWYRRNIFLVLAAIALPVMAWYSDSLDLKVAIPIYLAGLFVCCMFCHGELAQLKPAPRFLTTYYLMISLGGAIGGLLVGLVAPHLLTGYFELGIGLVACALLLLYRTFRIAWWAMIGCAAVIGATAWGAGKAIDYQVADSRVMMRNFYSVTRTREHDTPVPFRSMVHGGIVHGGQLLDPDMRLAPSSYFGPNSGYGRMFASLPDAPRNVGVIGLGAGSIIAYARKGDTFRFYEINPQVVELARREVTFMADSPARIDVVLGDGRLSLEREASQQFDVLAMDAFSGDSIPLHLLTREAMAIYLRHLKPGGVLAFQATNRFIDIAPVVASLAAEHGLTAVMISDSAGAEDGADYWISGTDQILVTSNRALLEAKKISEAAAVLAIPPGFRIWTDSFNNLLRVLK
ncbi:MAG: fused MFS/spermidine synthase, partial [Pseudomonadota bacterium]